LWPASVTALYGSESQLPKLTPNWDKRYVDLTDSPGQFGREPLPLSAIYVLGERSQEAAAPFVQPLDRADALLSLIANTYTNYLMDKTMQARQFDLLTRVLANVAVRKVTPHTDAGRLQDLCDCIFRDFISLKSCRKSISLAALPPDVRRGLPRRSLSEKNVGYALFVWATGRTKGQAQFVIDVPARQSLAAHPAAEPLQREYAMRNAKKFGTSDHKTLVQKQQ